MAGLSYPATLKEFEIHWIISKVSLHPADGKGSLFELFNEVLEKEHKS